MKSKQMDVPAPLIDSMEEIASQIQTQFDMDRAEAIARMNDFWRNRVLWDEGAADVIGHESATHIGGGRILNRSSFHYPIQRTIQGQSGSRYLHQTRLNAPAAKIQPSRSYEGADPVVSGQQIAIRSQTLADILNAYLLP